MFHYRYFQETFAWVPIISFFDYFFLERKEGKIEHCDVLQLSKYSAFALANQDSDFTSFRSNKDRQLFL